MAQSRVRNTRHVRDKPDRHSPFNAAMSTCLHFASRNKRANYANFMPPGSLPAITSSARNLYHFAKADKIKGTKHAPAKEEKYSGKSWTPIEWQFPSLLWDLD